MSDHCTNGTDSNCVLSESLIYLTNTARICFLVVFTIATLISIVGNLLTIFAIKKRKFRFLQKSSIVCLALSDLCSTFFIALNNLETFSQPEIVWNLGAFFCSFIPLCQMAGVLGSSVALVVIATDRYWNVVHALGKRWTPSPLHCVATSTLVAFFCFAAASPMFTFFASYEITVLAVDYTTGDYTMHNTHLCLSFQKAEMKIYYIVMAIIIFLPLTLVFIWFYYNIAKLVWQHRRPPGSGQHETAENSTESTVTVLRKHDVRVERKIRTFKIVVSLTIVFIVFRLPYFIVFLLKLSLKEEQGSWIWILNYASIAMQIINCGLNPLLYTFLNQTLNFCYKFKTYLYNLCCFCCSESDFDDFNNENPIARKHVQFQEQLEKRY